MKYVYILQSIDYQHFYVGITDDLRARLAKHNAGGVPHTSKYRPWQLKTYVAFRDPKQAIAFEKYLKSGSGRAFANAGARCTVRAAANPSLPADPGATGHQRSWDTVESRSARLVAGGHGENLSTNLECGAHTGG